MTYKTHPTLNGEALLLLWQLPLCFCHVLGHFVLALLNRTHNLVVTTLHVQAGSTQSLAMSSMAWMCWTRWRRFQLVSYIRTEMINWWRSMSLCFTSLSVKEF